MVRLQKIDPQKGIPRFYRLDIQSTLFGEFSFTREWGWIGNKPSRRMTEFFGSYEDANRALNCLQIKKVKKGYSIQR